MLRLFYTIILYGNVTVFGDVLCAAIYMTFVIITQPLNVVFISARRQFMLKWINFVQIWIVVQGTKTERIRILHCITEK